MKQTIDAIIASMTEYIINYAGTHGAWADWDDSETVRAEFSDCDAIKSIEEEDLDFYEVYRDALDAAYNKFNYKITLENYGKFGDMMSCDVWYATNKAELVEKVYDDCGGFEYAEEQYTEKELYEMVEEIGGEVEEKMERKISVYDIIDDMAEYIVRYADKHGAWTSWEDIEALRAEFDECKNILEVIDKNNFDFYEVYKSALDLALGNHGFYYKIVLSYYDNFEFSHLNYLAWYSKDKDKLVAKFYKDDGHSEYYTTSEIYKMVERI